MKKTLSVAMLLAGFAIGSQGQTTPVTPATPSTPAVAPANMAKPDLSGTWKLNLEKSDFGDMGGPISETDTLSQAGDDLKISVTSNSNERGKLSYEYSVKTDGTETPFPAGAMPDDSPLKIVSSKGEWQAGSLVITQSVTYADRSFTTKATYTLSADGKTLTKALHIDTENGAIDFRSVFDKG